MAPFEWDDFLAPLDPAVLLMAAILGAAMGFAVAKQRGGDQFATLDHLFWQLTTGAVMFIPLSLLRAFQDSESWERFLATYVLYLIFFVTMHYSARWCDGKFCDPYSDEITDIPTTELDTVKVLHPDGEGGVEWDKPEDDE